MDGWGWVLQSWTKIISDRKGNFVASLDKHMEMYEHQDIKMSQCFFLFNPSVESMFQAELQHSRLAMVGDPWVWNGRWFVGRGKQYICPRSHVREMVGLVWWFVKSTKSAEIVKDLVKLEYPRFFQCILRWCIQSWIQNISNVFCSWVWLSFIGSWRLAKGRMVWTSTWWHWDAAFFRWSFLGESTSQSANGGACLL